MNLECSPLRKKEIVIKKDIHDQHGKNPGNRELKPET